MCCLPAFGCLRAPLFRQQSHPDPVFLSPPARSVAMIRSAKVPDGYWMRLSLLRHFRSLGFSFSRGQEYVQAVERLLGRSTTHLRQRHNGLETKERKKKRKADFFFVGTNELDAFSCKNKNNVWSLRFIRHSNTTHDFTTYSTRIGLPNETWGAASLQILTEFESTVRGTTSQPGIVSKQLGRHFERPKGNIVC